MDLRAQLQDHLGDAFRIERELGGGGMSRVFMATEIRLNRRVAIKVLSPELAQGLNAERFEREILLSASLQQANIVPVLAAGDVAGLPYFTMPFVEGESLRSRLTGAGLPIDDVVTILRDVSKALAYAHARGIVHRDIKPDNVLLSGGTAVVTDFGIAKAISAAQGGADRPEHARDLSGTALTMVGTSIGTPPYMAPEQIAGDPNVDHRVDLYALGCMAFEMLTGRTPFGDLAPQRILAAHLSEKPAAIESLRPDCPPTLALLVARLLEKDPADRIASAAEVVQVLGMVGTASSESDVLSPRGRLVGSLVGWAVATLVVWIVAKAAVVGIGLPEWTVRGAVGVMLLGLPVLLATGWAKWMARKASSATPTLTPGGSNVPRPMSGTMTNIAIKANRHLSFRKAQRGGIYAMAAFVLLIAAFMITRSMGIGPAASLFAAGSLQAQDRILIAELAAAPEDTALASIIEEAVRAAMSQSSAVKLITPSDVAAALGEMQRDNDTPLAGAVAAEVATRTAAKAILSGRLARAGTGYAISLQLTGVVQGTSLASFQGLTDGQKDLLPVVDELTRKLRGKLGESLKQVQASVPLARATTSSLLALRKYSDAARANDIDSDFDKAVRLLREAVAIDSTFALAWRKLNAALTNAGASQLVRDSVLERAAQYADRLPPIERNLVLGAFNQGHSTRGNRTKALAAYQAVYAIDSTNSAALNQLTLLYQSMDADDSALVYTRRQVRLEPNIRNSSKLILALIGTGQFVEAQRIADSVSRAAPEAMRVGSFVNAMSAVRHFMGDKDSAEVLLAVQRAMPAIPQRIEGVAVSLEVALMEGRLQDFQRYSNQLDSLLETRGTPSSLDGFAAAAGDILFRDKVGEGVRALDHIIGGLQWAAIPAVDRPWFHAAFLYAIAGEPAKGRAVMVRRLAEVPGAATAASQRPIVAWIEGMLSLAEGKHAEAAARFRTVPTGADGGPSGLAELAWFGLARSFDAQHQTDSARVYYERYLDVPESHRWDGFADPLSLATVRKRLGQLYDDAGERTKAITQYQGFVDQWTAADPALQPAVASVKARLRELQTQEGN